jgi:hypothetical protein
MEKETVLSVLNAIDDQLYALYPRRYASMLVYGGAAAWLAGVTQRQPTNINVAISAAPSYVEHILKALGIAHNPKFYPHQGKGRIQVQSVDVCVDVWVEVSSPWYYRRDGGKLHAVYICDTLDVPQHRVVMHYQNGLSEPEYHKWANVWTRETMCQSSLDIKTNTLRIYRFLEAGYAMSDEIASLAMLGALGISMDIWANQHMLLTPQGWLGWDELPTFACQVAMAQGGEQSLNEPQLC